MLNREKLAEEMINHGYKNYKELAEKAGIQPLTLYRLARPGKVNHRFKTKIGILRALPNANPDELFTE